MKSHNKKILDFLPKPRILPWEEEGISNAVIRHHHICYNPSSQAIVIPHYDKDNNLVGIRERTLIKENEIYGFGNIDIKPKIKYATGVSQIRYAKQFVKILEDNYVLIKNAGGDEVEIYIEAYYDGKQCNFQIFDNKILAEFAKYEVSLPISVYRLGVRKISKWEEEIKNDWLLNGDV